MHSTWDVAICKKKSQNVNEIEKDNILMLRLKGKLRLTKRKAKIDFSYSFEPTKDLSTFSEVQFHHIGIQPILKQLFLTASSQSSLRIVSTDFWPGYGNLNYSKSSCFCQVEETDTIKFFFKQNCLLKRRFKIFFNENLKKKKIIREIVSSLIFF